MWKNTQKLQRSFSVNIPNSFLRLSWAARNRLATSINEILSTMSSCSFNFDKALNLEAFSQRCSVKKIILQISQNSQENTCLALGRLWHRCFPVNFAKFLRTPFYRTSPGDCFNFDSYWVTLLESAWYFVEQISWNFTEAQLINKD